MLAAQNARQFLPADGGGSLRRPVAIPGRTPATPATPVRSSPAPAVPVSTRMPVAPVRGTIATPVRSPIATPVSSPGFPVRAPISGAPVAAPVRSPIQPVSTPARGTAIVSSGTAGSVALGPQGGSGVLSTQPAGPPPSGSPPSMSMVTNEGSSGSASLPDMATAVPVTGNFSLPLGWIALAGVIVLVVLLARE